MGGRPVFQTSRSQHRWPKEIPLKLAGTEMKHIKEKEVQRGHVGQACCHHRHHHQTREKNQIGDRSRTAPGAAPPLPPAVCCCCCSGGACVTRQRRCVFLARPVRHARHVCHSWGSMFDTMLAEGRDMWTGLVAQHVLALSLPTPLPSATVFSRCSCAPSRPSRGASSVGVVWVCMCVNRHVSMRGFAFSFCTFFFLLIHSPSQLYTHV